MITAALVDIGNVILNLDFYGPLTKLVPESRADPEGRVNFLLERKDELETGRMSAEKFFEWASKRLEFEGSQEEFLAAWNDIFEPNLPMWETLRDLKRRGLKLILFSNTNTPHAEFFLKEYAEIFDLFEGQVFSQLVGAAKPDPAFYHHAIQEYSLKPEETLYIDDLPENITTGIQLGFKSWRYDVKTHEPFTRWIVETLD